MFRSQLSPALVTPVSSFRRVIWRPGAGGTGGTWKARERGHAGCSLPALGAPFQKGVPSCPSVPSPMEPHCQGGRNPGLSASHLLLHLWIGSGVLFQLSTCSPSPSPSETSLRVSKSLFPSRVPSGKRSISSLKVKPTAYST